MIVDNGKVKAKETLDSFFRWPNTGADGDAEETANICGSIESTLSQPWFDKVRPAEHPVLSNAVRTRTAEYR